MDIIMKRQKNWIGHILRGNSQRDISREGWRGREEEEDLGKSSWTG